VFAENPMFGIEHNVETTPQTLASVKVHREEDKLDIIDDTTMGSAAALAAYLATNSASFSESKDDSIVFDPHLGLATEALPAEFTCQDLWSIF